MAIFQAFKKTMMIWTWNSKAHHFLNRCLVKQPFFNVVIWFIIQLKQAFTNHPIFLGDEHSSMGVGPSE